MPCPAQFRDVSLQQFGRLMPSFPIGSKNRKTVWVCLCSCGNISFVSIDCLTSGAVKSCGCFCRELSSARALARNNWQKGENNRNFRHGHNTSSGPSPTYVTWYNMLTRCTNPNAANWLDYGGRGITIYAGWMEFENFLADMGERPIGRTLDRIDVNGRYEPGNCRWASPKEQIQNQRKHGVISHFTTEEITNELNRRKEK